MSSKYPHACFGPDPCKKCAMARTVQAAEYAAKMAKRPYLQWQGETDFKAPEFGFYAGGRTGISNAHKAVSL